MLFGVRRSLTSCRRRPLLAQEPARYIVLDRDTSSLSNAERWSDAIAQADEEFAHHMHVMGCGYDCHSHVARVLNLARYRGFTCHNKIFLAMAIFFTGHHVSFPRDFLRVWLPPAVLVFLVVLLATL